MKTLKIYDPPMCCSSGVCGPSVDPKLLKLAADVAFLKSRGVAVARYNLGHQPEAFTASPLVLAEMGEEAENLPLFVVEGAVKARGIYPNRAEMAAWFGILPEAASDKPNAELPMASSRCCDSGEEGCC
jgi:hypothetical protein